MADMEIVGPFEKQGPWHVEQVVGVEVITRTMRRLRKVGGLRRLGTIRPKAMFGKTLREGGCQMSTCHEERYQYRRKSGR